jgi:hypothetical protein
VTAIDRSLRGKPLQDRVQRVLEMMRRRRRHRLAM